MSDYGPATQLAAVDAYNMSFHKELGYTVLTRESAYRSDRFLAVLYLNGGHNRV